MLTMKTLTENEMIEVLWSLSLSENLGDVAEAIDPILKKFNLPTLALPALNDELERRGLVPDWAKD